MLRNELSIFLIACGLVATLGCATSVTPIPDLGGLYNRAARWRDHQRNPVIVIPGVLGSKRRDPF